MLQGIHSSKVGDWWPMVEPILQRATRRSKGRYDTAYLRKALDDRKAQLWLWVRGGRPQAVAVTETVIYPTGLKECRVVAIAGQGMRDWIGHLRGIEGWARSQGCRAMLLEGRLGWKRALPKDYTLHNVAMRKEL